MRDDYSLAEAFQRGLEVVEYPSPETAVSYYCRIYPEFDVEELQRQDVIEGGIISDQGPRVQAEVIGYWASLDYCDDDKHEIIHRVEFLRTNKVELFEAMREYAGDITDKRQRRVYRDLLEAKGLSQQVGDV